MPIIKSAIKKLRKDKKRTIINKIKRANLKKALKTAKAKKTAQEISAAFSILDKAVKTHLIHKNKAARLKSRLTKGKVSVSEVSSEAKKQTKKKPAPKRKTARKAK